MTVLTQSVPVRRPRRKYHTPEELRELVAGVVEDLKAEQSKTQSDIAAELGVSQPMIAYACKDGTGKYGAIQRRILEHYLGVEVTEERRYIVE